MAAIGVGVLTDTPALLFVGAVAVAYAGHARLTAPPDPNLTVERALTPSDPDPDTPVEVTVTVGNEGDRLLPDLRLVDGVPGDCRSPRGRRRPALRSAPGRRSRWSTPSPPAAGLTSSVRSRSSPGILPAPVRSRRRFR
ncbi:hypothetical protein ACFQL1_22170 [Halomicroarcula sp. GCM10025709]|uniref:hypothetical protein n=1 Tax=Halomicroarcula sp. GCM10025709 TaxID=3252669 RepID=UPI00361E1A4B